MPGLHEPLIAQRVMRNLQHYWPLDEVSGSAKDAIWAPSAGPIDLTVTGTVGSGVGPSANLPLARTFGGGANFLSTPDSPLFSLATPFNFTVAGWIFITSVASNRVMASHSSGVTDIAWRIGYNVSSGRLSMSVSPDGTDLGNSIANDAAIGAPSLSTWYFLLGRFDASAMRARLRVNMRAEATGIQIATVFDSASSFRLGHGVGTGHVGRLAQVGFWPRYLTDTEGYWLYNNGQGRDLRRYG